MYTIYFRGKKSCHDLFGQKINKLENYKKRVLWAYSQQSHKFTIKSSRHVSIKLLNKVSEVFNIL